MVRNPVALAVQGREEGADVKQDFLAGGGSDNGGRRAAGLDQVARWPRHVEGARHVTIPAKVLQGRWVPPMEGGCGGGGCGRHREQKGHHFPSV